MWNLDEPLLLTSTHPIVESTHTNTHRRLDPTSPGETLENLCKELGRLSKDVKPLLIMQGKFVKRYTKGDKSILWNRDRKERRNKSEIQNKNMSVMKTEFCDSKIKVKIHSWTEEKKTKKNKEPRQNQSMIIYNILYRAAFIFSATWKPPTQALPKGRRHSHPHKKLNSPRLKNGFIENN